MSNSTLRRRVMTLKLAISNKQTMQYTVMNLYERAIDFVHKEFVGELYHDIYEELGQKQFYK